MAAVYPTSIKSFTTKTDKVDIYAGAHINDLQNEVTAIEQKLGTNIQGSQTDLNARLGVCFETSGVIRKGTSFPASPVEGQLFYRTDEDTPYIYDGTDWDNLLSVADNTIGTAKLINTSVTLEKIAYSARWKSNVLYSQFAGNLPNCALSGTQYTICWNNSNSYGTFLQFPFRKEEGISNIVTHLYWYAQNSGGAGTGCLKVSCGSSLGSYINSNCPLAWNSYALSVDSLSNGTTYTLSLEMCSGINGYVCGIYGYALLGS